MTELTTKDSPVRVALCERDKRILINRPDSVIVLCLVCGGSKCIVMHTVPGETHLPLVRECTCDETAELSTTGENVWTSGGKVESLYAHLKREESPDPTDKSGGLHL